MPCQFAGNIALSRDGRVAAYRISLNDEEDAIRIGEREEGPFESVTNPVVTPDGSKVAYAFKRDGAWFLRNGDMETRIPGNPYSIFISADGASVGWDELLSEASGGTRMKVTALGKSGKDFSLVGHPVFSPTEPRVAYAAEEGGNHRFVVIGLKMIETPDRISDPVFSPDGRKVGYGARIGRELWWKVLDVASNR